MSRKSINILIYYCHKLLYLTNMIIICFTLIRYSVPKATHITYLSHIIHPYLSHIITDCHVKPWGCPWYPVECRCTLHQGTGCGYLCILFARTHHYWTYWEKQIFWACHSILSRVQGNKETLVMLPQNNSSDNLGTDWHLSSFKLQCSEKRLCCHQRHDIKYEILLSWDISLLYPGIFLYPKIEITTRICMHVQVYICT